MNQGDQPEQNQNSQFFYTVPPMYASQNTLPVFGQQLSWSQPWASNIPNLGLCMQHGNQHSLNDSGFSSMHSTFDSTFNQIQQQASFRVPDTPHTDLSESPSSKPVKKGDDTYFQIPGRLGLLNSNKTYIIEMEEIKRRLGSPEKLNTSYINGIVRKAKGRAAGQQLREKLEKNKLHVEHGRRTNVKTTCFLPLCEEEALQIARDFEFILSKFMPRTQLKQSLRTAVRNNLKGLRTDISTLHKSIRQREDPTLTLIRLFQFLPHELSRIFDEDQTLKLQQEHQSGMHPKRNADIQFNTQLQQELWNLNLATHNFAGVGLKSIFRNTSTPVERSLVANPPTEDSIRHSNNLSH